MRIVDLQLWRLFGISAIKAAFYLAEITIHSTNTLFKVAGCPSHAIMHHSVTIQVQVNPLADGIGTHHDIGQPRSIELLDRTFVAFAVTGNANHRVHLMKEVKVLLSGQDEQFVN
ncbi:hypothetical protein D3C71_1791090 [compost metagenome]